MGIRKSITGDGKPQRYYAFADTVVPPDPEFPRRRLALQFDVVDADLFDRFGPELFLRQEGRRTLDEAGFGFVRILTTEKRLGDLGANAVGETDWFSIEIDKKRGMPRAWFAPADERFELPRGGLNALSIERLNAEDPAGVVARLKKAGDPPDAKYIQAEEVLRRLKLHKRSGLEITALDVGQGACVAFTEGWHDVGYFDAGMPTPFNRRSFPKKFGRVFPEEGFVLLSHWDFDHYGLARRYSELLKLDWYAPRQELGPRGKLFQRSLGSRLHFIEGKSASLGGVTLARATGTKPKDRNSQGYVLRFERDQEAVLLTGDADYAFVPPAMKPDLTGLMTPHHCGKATMPPKPKAYAPKSRAVLSYGKPNNHKHPEDVHKKNLTDADWKLLHTANEGWSKRGNRTLYPLQPPKIPAGANDIAKALKILA